MSQRFIRIYKKLDIHEIKQHLLVYGDVSANCGNCQAIDLKLDAQQCPQCGTPFKYIAFRNVKHHLPKLQRLNEQRPELVFVDFEDFSRILGALKAEEFLR
ncbi:MAG: hypothetical protein Q8Q08_12390 [Candidatus Omnitrophota bacterium]|nr:hypothetical protein [Candidatus Omnitrophota bacterium]MDZ4242944.1 hypothetical protein [Candidatus Omnitrophota bacterium]